ncbi:hypothetical protein AgCh_012978 [Apium graveolens]
MHVLNKKKNQTSKRVNPQCLVLSRTRELAQKVIRELSNLILTRAPRLCNFVEWRGFKVVYKSKNVPLLSRCCHLFLTQMRLLVSLYLFSRMIQNVQNCRDIILVSLNSHR